MSQSARSNLNECMCFNLRRLTRVVTQRYDQALADCGLRITQLPILAYLAGGPATMVAVADELGMDRTTLVRNLQPLQREGYVTTHPSQTSRGLELCLTEAGKDLLMRAYPHWKEAQEEMRQALGTGRWDSLMGEVSVAGESLARIRA